MDEGECFSRVILCYSANVILMAFFSYPVKFNALKIIRKERWYEIKKTNGN